MPTLRQQIAGEVARLVARLSPCRCILSDARCCGATDHKLVLREQHGVDLQCRACGRLAEVKAYRLLKKPTSMLATTNSPGRKAIPGGSYAVWMRQQAQGYRVDLHVAEYTREGEVVVRAVRAEDQPIELRRPRTIRHGERRGHVVADILLTTLPQEHFPIVARGRLTTRALRLVSRLGQAEKKAGFEA